MKGFVPLVLGIFGTLAFSWAGLTFIPNLQIGHLDPQMDEEGNDAYPAPRSGMAERGRHIYVANGCLYCHSQQIRADYAASDIDRKWGTRRSAPRDYIFDRPVLLGKTRIGPDLANVGKRAPAEDENAPPQASPSMTSPPAGPASPANAPKAAAAAPAASATPSGASAANVAAPPANLAANAKAAPSPVNAPASASPPSQQVAANQPASPASAQSLAGASPAAAAAASPGMQQAVADVAGAATSAQSSPSDSPPPYSAAWHHQHLYSPRSLNQDSNMPSYKFLYAKRRIGGEPSADAIKLRGDEAPGEGWEIVPSYDAKCLVAYLMSLDQSHDLKEAKPPASVSPPAPKAAK